MGDPVDLDALDERLRWHEYRPWAPTSIEKQPFPDACGDCGKHADRHPMPLLHLDGEEAVRHPLAARAALNERDQALHELEATKAHAGLLVARVAELDAEVTRLKLETAALQRNQSRLLRKTAKDAFTKNRLSTITSQAEGRAHRAEKAIRQLSQPHAEMFPGASTQAVLHRRAQLAEARAERAERTLRGMGIGITAATERLSGSDAERHDNAARLAKGQNESGPVAAGNSHRALGTPSKLPAERTHVDDTATPADPARSEDGR